MQRSKEGETVVGPLVISDRGGAKPTVRRYTTAMIIDSDRKSYALTKSGEVKPFRRKVTQGETNK
ncbi:MAG: hypothetical protein KatS3mg087_0933 [Patescibacteria group bacterium]|nr:MAG: hypothetical protein KatS3mg087_0933 [Patescibacteria group bacterium]